MQNLELLEILLVSHKEKRAKKIDFHPSATVIQGANDTGKSSIIKSIYHTFGADPWNIDSRWISADISSLIKFAINGIDYSIFRQGRSFSLFSSENELMGTFSSVSRELAPKLAGLFDFKLKLVDRKGESKTPPPAYLFLPFYIDQDQGWVRNWGSFDKLAQFSNWRKEVVSYHTGLRPNRYYELKSEAQILERSRLEPINHEKALAKIIEEFSTKLLMLDFAVDLEVYKKEIHRLLRKCESLRNKEREFKDKLIELETERGRLENQNKIVIHAKAELEKDYKFAMTLEDEHVECPTCGASYSNSFAQKFAIACDEDRCSSLLQQIRSDRMTVQDKIEEHRQSLSAVSTELEEINSILMEKKGKLTLRDLIENEGKRELLSTLHKKLDDVQAQVSKIDSQLRHISRELRKLTNRQRTAEITGEYGEHLRKYFNLLNVADVKDRVFKTMDSGIQKSGSDQPRAILAYSFSILHVIKNFGSATFCPIIIDAPQQQEQDKVNHKRMLDFINEYRPSGSQLILGLVDGAGVDFQGKIVEMKEKYHALSLNEYKRCAEEIEPYSAANLGT